MNDRTDPAAQDWPSADSAGSLPQLVASAMTLDDAMEIVQICNLAGRSDLIADFFEASASPASVRNQLLIARAQASGPEIISRICPDAAAFRTAVHNPVLDAAKQLAAKSASLRKGS